jgi:MFS family permease
MRRRVSSEERGSHHVVTFAVLAVAAGTYSTLMSVVAPALPDIQQRLGLGPTGATWILTAYLLSATVATPIAGRLGDMFGKDRVLVCVLATICLGTALSAIATSLPVMLAGRALQGVGGALFPLSFSVIRDEFPRERLAMGLGLMSAIAGIGGGVGIVLAGPIISGLSYHAIFWVPLAPLLLATLAVKRVVPRSPVRAGGRIDWAGAALLSTWLTLLLLAITQGSHTGWTSAEVLGLAAAALALAACWVAFEGRSRAPLVDMRMMRARPVWTTNVASVLVGYGMFSSFVLVPQFVETPAHAGFGFGASVTTAGLFMLPSTVAMLVGSVLMGRISGRYGPRRTLVLGAALSAVGFVSLSLAHDARWHVLAAMACNGLGTGLSFGSMPALIVAAVAPSETGVATGVNTNVRNIGGALGSQVSASILAGSLVAGVPTEAAFTVAFGVAAIVLVAAVAAAASVPSPRVRGEALELVPEPSRA